MMSAEGGNCRTTPATCVWWHISKSVFRSVGKTGLLGALYSASEKLVVKRSWHSDDHVNGNWWVVYHAYANGTHTLGHSVEPMRMDQQQMAPYETGRCLVKRKQTTEWKMELSDNFSKPELGIQWTFWKEYAPQTTEGENAGEGTRSGSSRALLVTAYGRY